MSWLLITGLALTILAASYACIAVWANRRIHVLHGDASDIMQAVTVFKPLCGLEPRLRDNLAALCEQSHPDYQLLFGVRDPADPVIAIVEQLRAAYPARDISLIIDPQVHGSNLKVSNLINLFPHARHDWLVIADSDIDAPTDYLTRVTAPLANPKIGIVTCLYRGRAIQAFWARVGTLFINTWFAPSVRLTSAFGGRDFGFGATIAMRRDALLAIGGFAALNHRLADDYWLGKLTRDLGLRTELSDVVVTTEVTEETLPALWSREVRWMRTIRSLNPLGFAFTWITFTFPLLAVGLLLSPTPVTFSIAGIGILARLILHWQQPSPDVPRPGHVLLAPLRDMLLLCEWAAAWMGQTVQWRKHTLSVHDNPAKTGTAVR